MMLHYRRLNTVEAWYVDLVVLVKIVARLVMSHWLSLMFDTRALGRSWQLAWPMAV
jgi:hypothetical protein